MASLEAALRQIRLGLIVCGALGGALLPFLTQGASSPRFTDIEARLGYGVLAVIVNGAFGALAGWALGALLTHFLRE